VTVGGKKVDINHRLVEHGFAYPTFYSSMNDDEIKAFLALTKTARTKKLPVWKNLAKTIPAFDFDLRMGRRLRSSEGRTIRQTKMARSMRAISYRNRRSARGQPPNILGRRPSAPSARQSTRLFSEGRR
jgi:hypothetical protein